ncbi:hypothetical protein [Streptomyces sp. 2A115]|uniref:hypothetical protein n=1 Tax=Streptomyces sp. 2A115 TaxID=3457439 RepID=UPI003FD66F9B
MPERSVALQVSGDGGGAAGHRRTAAGIISSPPAVVRAPTFMVPGTRVGTRLWEEAPRPEAARAR